MIKPFNTRMLPIAIMVGMLAACGGSGDNTNLETIAADVDVSAEENNSFYIPNEFFEFIQYDGQTTQFQGVDSYNLFTYTDEFVGEQTEIHIISDALPGDSIYARVLITGLTTDAEATASVQTDDTGMVSFAVEPASGIFGQLTYSEDPTTLSFDASPKQITNGTWVWIKVDFAEGEFDTTRDLTLLVGNDTHPVTGQALPDGIISAQFSVVTPAENSQSLAFSFSDKVGLNAATAGVDEIATLQLTNLSLETGENIRGQIENSHVTTGLTAKNIPVGFEAIANNEDDTDPQIIGEYRVIPRGTQANSEGQYPDIPWTSEPGTASAYDLIQVKVTPSPVKLDVIKTRFSVGEGDTKQSADWTIETKADIEGARAVLFPPKNSLTTSTTVNARGQLFLRESADDDAEFTSIKLMVNSIDASDVVTELEYDLLASGYNPVNGIWRQLLDVPADGRISVEVVASTNKGETVSSDFTIHNASILPTEFPADGGDSFVKPMDVTVDIPNNQYFVLSNGNDKLYSVDMSTGVRTLFYDLLDNGLRNAEGVQFDQQNNRVLVGDRPTDDIWQFNATDSSTITELSISQDGGNPAYRDPAEMAIDYDNNRLLSANNNTLSVGIMAIDLTTGSGRQYARGRTQSVDIDFDNNRYIAVLGLGNETIQTVPIVPTDENGDIPLQEFTRLGDDTYSGAKSIAVASYARLASPESLEEYIVPKMRDSQPANEDDDNMGFALVADTADDTIYKVDLITGARSVFSDATTPNDDIPFSGAEAIAIEYGLGFALVVDEVDTQLIGVDLETGQRVLISK